MKAPTDDLKIKTNVCVYLLINCWIDFCSLIISLHIELNDMSVNKTLYFMVSVHQMALVALLVQNNWRIWWFGFFPLQILKYFSDRKTTRKQKCQLTELFISFLYIN